MQAAIDKDKADLARMKAELDRAEALFKEQLMAKQDFELQKLHLRGPAVHRASSAKRA